MKTATVFLAVAFALLFSLSPALAGSKEEALAKIRATMDSGHLDDAKHMIDHLLKHNPGDEDLLALLEVWRIRKGQLGPILEEEGLAEPDRREHLRELCWRIVRETMAGNPEEWEPLLDLPEGDAPAVRALLEAHREGGSEEDMATAKRLLDSMEETPPPEPTANDLVAMVRKGRDPAVEALRLGEEQRVRKLLPFAKQIHDQAGEDFELRFAAAGCLLALGETGPRAELREALRGDLAVRAAAALEVLLRHPGRGDSALTDLYKSIAADERILRVKSTLLSMTIEAVGEAGRPGARKFLEGLLDSPEEGIDAARALGALHDAATVPALLGFLRSPPAPEESGVGGGLGFLGGASPGSEAVAAAEEVRPALVGAIAILRATAKR